MHNSEPAWWTRPQRVLQPILRTCDGAVDMRALAQTAADEGYTAILQNVGGMVAWYPSAIPFHVPTDGMRGDPLGELIEAAHSHGIRVMARFDLSGLRSDAYAAHPEWFYQSRDGQPMIDKGMYATCLSTSFIDDFFFPMFEEILGRYAIDGVFFNMFGYRDTDRRGVYHGPCHCPACKARFQAEYGMELPTDPASPRYLSYLRYREGMFESAAQRVYDRIKRKNPAIAFLDGRGRKATHSLMRGLGDVAEMELHWMTTNPRSLDKTPPYGWRYAAGESCRHVRTLPGKATMINVFQCGAGRLIGHSVGWNVTTIAQTVANGGWPYVAFTGTPWMESDRSRGPMLSLFQRMRREEACLTGLTSAATVALLTSDANLDPNLTRRDTAELLHEFRGWYQTLVQRHIEFDVVDTLQLPGPAGKDLLARYALVIVPPIAMLGDEACAVLDAYVKSGGRAIVCGEAGLYHADGEARETPGFACVGMEAVLARRAMVKNAFFHTDGADLLPALSATRLLSLNGPMVYARPRPGAQVYLPMEAEIEYASPEQEVYESTPGHPGLIVYAYGEGKTAYLPWTPARLAHLYGQEDHVQLLYGLIDAMLPAPPLTTNAPACVEVTLHAQPATGHYVVQFVNFSGHDGATFHAPLNLTDLEVAVRVPRLTQARCEPYGMLPVRADAGGIAFTLPKLADYELIELMP